jgi:putative serine/threonine protein kinase
LDAGEVVSLKELEVKHCKVLCYPRCEQETLEERVKELERLGVKALEFTGGKSVFGVPVLGKGCVGIVVGAYTVSGKAALKIRRIDADRKGMFHEGEMLRKANSVGVGPALIEASENFLLMELVEGKHFPEWLEALDGTEAGIRVRLVLKDVLEQCYRLDEAGLDHGELSNAYKHIIVDVDDQPRLIDFETASINRKPSNVTSICQYLFLGSKIAEKTKEKLGSVNEKQLIQALRSYKREQTKEKFEKILEVTGLYTP